MPRRYGILLLLATGCATVPPDPVVVEALPPTPSTRTTIGESPAVPVAIKNDPIPAPTVNTRPAYAASETLPIDLPTVFRLVDSNSPVIGVARARLREAEAVRDKADVLWLPTVQAGAAYNRFDGQTQNQAGAVFGVSRSNLFSGGGVALGVDTGDAFYQPLVARQLTRAAAFGERSAVNAAQLDAVIAYLDLLQVHAQLAVNADTLARAEQMLKYAKDAQASQLSKTAGDVNRAETEVYLRRQERIDLQGRAGAASARLGQLLLLDPAVVLVPGDAAVAPVELIDPTKTLDDLVGIAVANHPDLAANRALVAAAWDRVRKAKNAPFFPKVAVQDQVGSFGGGVNADLANFSARNALAVQLYWELQNLGFGTAANARAERAAYDRAAYEVAESQARITATVAEAARTAAAKAAGLDLARRAVTEAAELYRKLQETSFNMVGPRAQYDALEPLLAIQALNQARTQYLSAVVDYNRAQFRLFAALGYPAECTIHIATAIQTAVSNPVVERTSANGSPSR
jgi:outer membrane protein TolC